MPRRERRSIDTNQFFGTSAGQADDLDYLFGAPPEETADRAQARGLPLLDVPLDAVEPDPDQLRRLPHPARIQHQADQGDRAAQAMLASLRELGASIQHHGQAQPAIAYPFHNPGNPAITHRLLHGQRRWSAATLVGVPTLWIVEVPQPNDAERLLRQYAENEQRQGLHDIERAWALMALKRTLRDDQGYEVSWGVIEEHMQLSTTRRQDLLRLLRFDAAGQDVIVRYGWSEWTLRPLHMALNAQEITLEAATALLEHLSTVDTVTPAVVRDLLHGQRLASDDAVLPPAQSDAAVAPSSEPRAMGTEGSTPPWTYHARHLHQHLDLLATAVAEQSLSTADQQAMRDDLRAVIERVAQLIQTIEDR